MALLRVESRRLFELAGRHLADPRTVERGLVIAEATACSSLAVPDCWLVSAAGEDLCVATFDIMVRSMLLTQVEAASSQLAVAKLSPITAALLLMTEAALMFVLEVLGRCSG